MLSVFSDRIVAILTEREDYHYYTLPANSILYRGNSLEYTGEKALGSVFSYFGSRDTAKEYGLVSIYETTKPLHLLAMDDMHNVEKLYEENEDIRRAISSSFGYSSRRKRIERDSNYAMDFAIITKMCSLGFDGYAHESMKSDMLKDFHAEYAICSPRENVKLIGREAYSSEKIANEVRQSRLREYEYENKKRGLSIERDASSVRRLFD